jgi:hypothetical protein
LGIHRDAATSENNAALTHGNRHADEAAFSAWKRALQSSGIFSTQNNLDDCLSRFENAHSFSPMNLHLQPQESFFSPLLQKSGVFVQHLRSRFWSGFQRHAE